MVYEDLKFKFDRDGFVIIENFLSEEQVIRLKDAGEKLTRNVPVEAKAIFIPNHRNENLKSYFFESAENISYFYEKSALDENLQLLVDPSLALNKVGHALHRLHPTFEECTFTDNVASVCRALALTEPVVPQSMYIYKNPGVGSEVSPHQDSTFLSTTPDTLVGFWLALDDATLENGCLCVIPGSHKNGLHRTWVRDGSADGRTMSFRGTLPEYDEGLYVPAEVKKSGLVLLHGKVVHKSGHNESKNSRHAYTFHVFDGGVSRYAEHNWLQAKAGFKPLYSKC